MPSDFPALDVALDARSVMDLFLFELLSEGFPFPFLATTGPHDTILFAHAAKHEGRQIKMWREDDAQTERQNVSRLGLVCPIGVPAWALARVPVQRGDTGRVGGDASPHSDVTHFLSESPSVRTFELYETKPAHTNTQLAFASHCRDWHHQGKRDRSWGGGGFVQILVEEKRKEKKKVLTSGSPRQVVMSNMLIIPSALQHTHYAPLASAAAAARHPIVCRFISEQIGHWKSLTGAELNSLTWIRL